MAIDLQHRPLLRDLPKQEVEGSKWHRWGIHPSIPVGQEAREHRDHEHSALWEKLLATDDLDLLILTGWFALS